ncbi:MAG TPA: hypothetical protein VH019_06160 [Rhizomicrobium sp.]|jgi:hypothetical protein|nr:hypothetical protein [Rhizomicrobium sp.]
MGWRGFNDSFWRWYDRAARVEFATTILGAAKVTIPSAAVITFLGEVYGGLDVFLAVGLAALAAILILLLFAIALEVNFQQSRRRPAKEIVAAAPRHLTVGQRDRFRQALRLPEGLSHVVEVYSENTCEECRDYAEQLRDAIGVVPGWTVKGGVNMWESPRECRGLQLWRRDPDTLSSAEHVVTNALIAAGIDYSIHVSPETDPNKKAIAVLMASRR